VNDSTQSDADRLDQLYANFEEAAVRPLWREYGLLPQRPRTIAPHLWRWREIRKLAEEAGALVPVDKGGDRRVLALSHPDLGGKPFATPTLWAGIQFLNGRETAPPHRHSPGALRFVLEGSGVWTLVNGDPVLMEPGDLVLTPSYNWHAHDNPGTEPMIWFDGLDLPMVQSLDAVFFEDGPDELEPYEQRWRSHSEGLYAAAGLRPAERLTSGDNPSGASSLAAYRWAATDAALESLLTEAEVSSAVLRYTDPMTGSDVMPTLRAEICRVRATARTRPQRKVGSSVVLVHRGTGDSVVGDQHLHWERGDVFVVPSWSTVEHHAAEESDLFVLSDTPVIERVGLARQEFCD